VTIERHVLSNGQERFVVRVKRYGKRRVLLRTDNVNKAISAEMRAYYDYLSGVWLYGKGKSHV
jgi:hypothetical protein